MSTAAAADASDLSWIDAEFHRVHTDPADGRFCIRDRLQRAALLAIRHTIIKGHRHHPA